MAFASPHQHFTKTAARKLSPRHHFDQISTRIRNNQGNTGVRLIVMQRLLIYMILVVVLAILQHVFTVATGMTPAGRPMLDVDMHASQVYDQR
jgi:hypothetical protein